MSDRGARHPVCPSCGGGAERRSTGRGVPVHQVKLVPTRAQAALDCRRGDIRCASARAAASSGTPPSIRARMRYEDDYESTQAVSPTFNRFHERLARDLIERFDLHGKKIVEIGCGQGEFITMLAEIGGNGATASTG